MGAKPGPKTGDKDSNAAAAQRARQQLIKDVQRQRSVLTGTPKQFPKKR